MKMQDFILETRGVCKSFHGQMVLDHISLMIPQGCVYGLLGPNGAGKTTAFNLVVGVYKPSEGKVIFDNEDITGLPPNEICKKGIGRTFQVVKPFGKMTVLQNIMAGAFVNTAKTQEARQIASEVMEKMGLQSKRDKLAASLTIPERKRLEMAKALATRPKLMLLDEVLAGLNPTEIQDAVLLIKSMIKDGVTILMIEHVLQATMAICERIVVLNYGQKLAEGTPEQVTGNEEVIKAYLGDDYA
jgi:branched-chain amino acid transport system ATP-binding protein